MREFDLVSVDWNSVRLMQAGQAQTGDILS